jgi:hypothetical protein
MAHALFRGGILEVFFFGQKFRKFEKHDYSLDFDSMERDLIGFCKSYVLINKKYISYVDNLRLNSVVPN